MRLNRRTLLMFTLLVALVTTQVTADFKISDIDYIKPENASVSFGGGLWANNFIKTKAVFPLSETWKTKTGKTESQPVIIDDIVITTAENTKIIALRKSDGNFLNKINIAQDNPDYSIGNMFVIKKEKGKYQIIAPLNDGVITSWDLRISYNASDEPINAAFGRTWSYDYTLDANISDVIKSSKLLAGYMTLLTENSNLYLGFGTYSGYVIVINSSTGKSITNGKVEYAGTMGMGIPYKNFNSLIIPNSDELGTVLKGTVVNGVLNMGLNSDIIHDENLASATAYSVIKNPATNQTIGMLVLQDGYGSIIGYNSTDGEVMFVVDKYKGSQTVNGFSITEKYILVTLSNIIGDKSKIVCIDYEQAIIDGYDNAKRRANNAIIFEEDLGGRTYGAALALQIVDQEKISGGIKETIYREVFITANKGTGNNLRMYYMDQYNASTKRPIAVPYAFKDGAAAKSTLSIKEGINTPLSYANGYLVFCDGEGNTIAYTAKEENNLALINFVNSEEKVAKGKTYTAQVDIVNYKAKQLNGIPIQFFINDILVYSGKIDIAEDGLTVNFQYTVPKEYPPDKLKIDAKLNMIEPRTIEETTYTDNTQTLNIDVVPEEIDLEAKNIQQTSPVVAESRNTAVVTIANNSDMDLEDVLVHYKLSGKTVSQERINLSARTSKDRPFTWESPNFDTNVILSVVVDPDREIDDINRDNNTAIKTVKVNKPAATFIGCNDNNPFESPSYTWVYRVDEIYRDVYETWYDENGKRHREKVGTEFVGYDIYERTETAKYTERLTIKTDVNTGQQNSNSRGGWEILPYVNNNTEKAKRTTRSGYGIELQVTATYTTNPAWETPPSGWSSAPTSYPWGRSSKHGEGWLKGLTSAQAIAHLPNGKTVNLVRVSGSSKYSVTWQLPEIEYTPKGLAEKWKGRYFAMDAKTPDGKYNINVEVINVGQTNMRCNVKDYIEIYGDVWRDTNIKSQSK